MSKVWLITGSSRGFGRAIAESALRRGHRVVATARDKTALANLVTKYGEAACAVALDVTSACSILDAVDEAYTKFGHIDVLVNNAGFGLIGSVEETSPDRYRRQFETNLFGAIEMTRAVLPAMRARRTGHIVNISSSGGLVARPGLGYYHATKFALEGLTEALAQETPHLGIKVTLIEPGAFRTDWNSAAEYPDPSQTIDDYRVSCGPIYDMMSKASGRQEGDPAKAAELIVDLVESPDPPLRLPLGGKAFDRIRAKFVAFVEDLDRNEKLIRSVDF